MTPHKEIPPPRELEKAVRVLLQPVHAEYLQKLENGLAEDPNYLFNHEFSVGNSIQQILLNGGVRWKPAEIKQLWPRLVRIALLKVNPK